MIVLIINTRNPAPKGAGIIGYRWSDHKRSNHVSRRNPIQRPVSRGNVSPRLTPNPDWGIAWGTGRTNIPSLYNVKSIGHQPLIRAAHAELVSSASHTQHPPSHTSKWWSQTGSNRRPPECKSGALPAELWPQQGMVGTGGLEPPTSRLSGVCSNHLSYVPQT